MERFIGRFFRSAFEDDYDWLPCSSNVYRIESGNSESRQCNPMMNCTGESRLVPLGKKLRLDVTETPEAYHLSAELPGIKREDIKITTEGDMLTIQAEKKQETKKDTDTLHLYERTFGKFQRSLKMPENCNLEDAKPSFENGVLILMFSKKEPSLKKTITL